jgi:RNA polymerase sigma-70 factor (ECF subfamily)
MADRAKIVAWVGAQVMPHEAAVRAWLRRSLVSHEDIDDLIQEAYARIAALEEVDHILRPDGYFFQTVRNLLGDHLRRSRIVRIDAATEIDSLSLYDDEPSPERITAARRELARVRELIAALPDRCRRIFELRKIHGLPQREIARLLGVNESAVENDGAKGLRLILKALRDEGALGAHETPGATWPDARETARAVARPIEGGGR